jgi:ABC-type phosphate transport system substrate-binding protein
MKTINQQITMTTKRVTAILLLAGTSFLSSFAPHPDAPKVEIAVIINSANPVNKMGADFVKNYWLRRFVKRWKETNKGILPADHKTKSPEQDLFYNTVLGLPSDAVESYLSARQYQSGDKPPEKFASDADIINFVSNEVGAIGYVNVASVSADNKSVKIILLVSK